MQNYLKPNRVLTYQDQIDIFSYRSEMNEVNKNVTGLKEDQTEICLLVNIMKRKLQNNYLGSVSRRWINSC